MSRDPESVATALRELIAEMAPLGGVEVRPETVLVAELGFDSLGLIELLVVIEDRFDLPPLEERELFGLERVGDLEAIVTTAVDQAPLR